MRQLKLFESLLWIVPIKIYFSWYSIYHPLTPTLLTLVKMFRGNLKKKSLFKDIIQIKVDHPPTYPIFDKLFFDKF